MRGTAILLVLMRAGSAVGVEEQAIEVAAVRAAVGKSLPILQDGARTFRERSEGRCISCHHQGLVLQTVALARERGFAVEEGLARAEVERVHGFYERRRERYVLALRDPAAAPQADPFGNFTVHVGYWLWGLTAERIVPDETMLQVARLLASKQQEDGHWTFTDTARAPMQASDFATTALSAFALKHFGQEQDAVQVSRRIANAQTWLLKNEPHTTDDMAFRLFGLFWTEAPVKARRAAANDLRSGQQESGGWSQQDNMPVDAYATGLALVALHQAGELPVTDAAYASGIRYLLKTQQADGSWFVKTRAIPTNPYFESGFPYGKSQFISYAGTCWATMALTLAVPPEAE